MTRLTRRLTALTASALAATALAVASAPAPASAQVSLDRQSLACGGGGIVTSAPTGSANQNFVRSTTADATWYALVYRWDGRAWSMATWQQYVATVSTGDGPGMGGLRGQIRAWRPAAGGVYSAYGNFTGTPGQVYAVLNAVYDSDQQVSWQWSLTGTGSYWCRA